MDESHEAQPVFVADLRAYYLLDGFLYGPGAKLDRSRAADAALWLSTSPPRGETVIAAGRS